jgi:hypothetical protein
VNKCVEYYKEQKTIERYERNENDKDAYRAEFSKQQEK